MARSKKILLKKPEGEGWMMKAIGDIETTEVCDALLSAFCMAVQVTVIQDQIPPELIKELVNSELDRVLCEENKEG